MGNKFGGFGGFGGGGNMQAMMRQAQKLQQDAMRAKEELDESEFEGSASGELVKVVINGKFEMVSVSIKPEAVDPDDVEMLEDLVTSAVNDCLGQIERKEKETMPNMPGMM